MNSQILLKVNDFLKKRLIELSGFLMIIFSLFVLLSITTYTPSDPNFIYTPENTEIKNFGGFYGSVTSDFLLQSIGLISFLFTFNFFYWGTNLIYQKKIKNFFLKIFFTLIYIILGTTLINIFYNNSFWLIDNGNGGFVGQIIKENTYIFSNLIENVYVGFSLLLLSTLFFILSLNLQIKEIFKILLFPYLIIKKILSFFNRKKTINQDLENINTEFETKNTTNVILQDKQPILPFALKKTVSPKNNFKLPPINFLEKNPDLKNKKNISDSELNKNSQFLEKILLDFGVEGKI